MSNSKNPVHNYIKETLWIKYHENPKSVGAATRSLIGEYLLEETKKQIIEQFELPRQYAQSLLYKNIEQLAKGNQEFIIENSYQNLKALFLPIYEEDCLEVFIREMSFIISVFEIAITPPAKKELEYSSNVAIKNMSKHLSGFVEAMLRVYKKPEWAYIQELIYEQYIEAKKQRGFNPKINISAENFFLTAQWMDIALKNISDDKFKDYKANGRMQKRRNNALIALAFAYERCFNKAPTSTISANKPCFANCVNVLLQGIIYTIDDGTETFSDLIKKTINEYKNRKASI